jgi:hypothetical protein
MAPLGRHVDGRRREAVGAQAIARGARIVGVEQALPQPALRIDGFEPERAQERPLPASLSPGPLSVRAGRGLG